VLEQAMILGDGDFISLEHLAGDVAGRSAATRPTDLREAVRTFSQHHILDVLARTGSNKRAAARLLGISLASLYRKLNPDLPEPPDEAAGEE
jgi:transcriptional regulator with PAS, ATPase and Fis domain